LQKTLGIENSILPITLQLSKYFYQKFAINWTNTCKILCQVSGNPGVVCCKHYVGSTLTESSVQEWMGDEFRMDAESCQWISIQ